MTDSVHLYRVMAINVNNEDTNALSRRDSAGAHMSRPWSPPEHRSLAQADIGEAIDTSLRIVSTSLD